MASVVRTMKRGAMRSYLLLNLKPARSRSELFWDVEGVNGVVKECWSRRRVQRSRNE